MPMRTKSIRGIPVLSSDDYRPRIGEWNHLEACIGQRGTGKSTYQCRRVWELTREAGGAYVVGHSLGARLPERLPEELGGHELPITYHHTLAGLERGLRSRPDRWHILAPPLVGEGKTDVRDPETADDLLRYVIRLSSSLRDSAYAREHPMRAIFGARSTRKYTGIRCIPIIVIIDEGIAIESAGIARKEENRWFLQFLYSLRHLHVALLYAIQNATARSWQVLEQATAIHCFAVRHEWALNAIRAAGASKEQIEEIRHLDKFERVTFGEPVRGSDESVREPDERARDIQKTDKPADPVIDLTVKKDEPEST